MENAISKVAHHNLAAHFSLNPIGRNFHQKLRRLDWTNLSDRLTNQPLFFPLCFFSKHKKHAWFLLLITWWNHVTSCTAVHLDARSSVVFWVNFSGIPALFYSRRSLCLTALFGVINKCTPNELLLNKPNKSALTNSPTKIFCIINVPQ